MKYRSLEDEGCWETQFLAEEKEVDIYPYLLSPEPDPEDVSSDVGAEDDDEPVEDHEEGEEAEHQEPEPDEDVDLLVDDVEREDAQHVVVLDVAGCPVLVERALRHSKEKELRWDIYTINVFLWLAKRLLRFS